MPTFDLVTQPWVPVRFSQGAGGRAEAGLAELFTGAHEIDDITLQVPPAASGLWRVLYLIAARITGLDGLEAADGLRPWKRDRNRVLAAGRFDPGAVEEYFAGFPGRFDLFHPELPWLQDSRLATECAKSTGINKLVMSRAAGNNHVWLSHHTDLDPHPVRAAEAAWYLLAWQYYGPSGNITARTVNGRTAWNMTAGPLRSRVSFHPLGKNLYESLIAGIPYPGAYAGPPDPDRAPWEDDTFADLLGLPPTREGLSGPLTGQFRHALLLTPSPDGTQVTDARITWGWRMPTTEIRDPYLIYDTKKTGGTPYARYARADRAIWRDLDALLLQDTGSGTRRPAVFDHLPGSAVTGKLRVRAFGFDQDGQVKDTQWFTASTPPVLTVRDADEPESEYDDAYEISAAREAAENVGSDLDHALRRAWATLSDPTDGKDKRQAQKKAKGPWQAHGLSRYWASAEEEFWEMVRNREFDHPSNTFIRKALAAYDAVTDRHANRGPRVVRALERARGGIFATWSRAAQPPLEADDA